MSKHDGLPHAATGARAIVETGHSVTVSGMDSTPLPGDFLITTIDQPVTNALVWAAQLCVGDASRFTHAAVYVGGPGRLVIEMAPGGLVIRHLGEYAGRPIEFSSWDLADATRQAIVDRAWELFSARPRIGYGWLSYLYGGLARFGIRPARLMRYLQSGAVMECAQYVGDCYERAGVHLFEDGRPYRVVSPGALGYVLSAPKLI
jgi:hypothetical protein